MRFATSDACRLSDTLPQLKPVRFNFETGLPPVGKQVKETTFRLYFKTKTLFSCNDTREFASLSGFYRLIVSSAESHSVGRIVMRRDYLSLSADLSSDFTPVLSEIRASGRR
jgi:hypothetical protein